MTWDFKPGMRVVCVNDVFDSAMLETARHFGVELPVKGVIYTVRDVYFDELAPAPHRILLVEIVNPKLPFIDVGETEADFNAKRFRPVDENRLDVFRNLLVDLPKEEELA